MSNLGRLSGVILPLQLREVLGGYAAIVERGQVGGELEHAAPGVLHLMRRPLLPYGISQAVQGLCPPLPPAPELALNHTHLRYYVPFAPLHTGILMARDVLGGDDVRGRWALNGPRRPIPANNVAPVVCEQCLVEAQRRKQRSYWPIEWAAIGYEMCYRHVAPMLHCCEECAKKVSWKMYAKPPTIRCHCGAARVPRDLSGIEAFAHGLSTDIFNVLTGCLDNFSGDEIMKELSLVSEANHLRSPANVREFLENSGAWRYLNSVCSANASADAILDSVKARKSVIDPLVGISCINALKGCVENFVSSESMTLSTNRFISMSQESPVIFREPQVDVERLAATKKVLEGIVRRGNIRNRQCLQAALSQELSYVVCMDEDWLINQMSENWPSRLRVGRRRALEDDEALESVKNSAEIIMMDPLHPHRTVKLLLGNVMHYSTYVKNKEKFPKLRDFFDVMCEDLGEFKRRVYAQYIILYPLRVQPGMPVKPNAIGKASDERISELLNLLNVDISLGVVGVP